MMGWCSSGSHSGVQEGKQIGCPGKYQPFFVDKGKVVPQGDERVCDCACHAPESVVGSTQQPKRRRRKQ